MKFVCLAYYDEKAWLAIPAAEQDKLVQECFAYDDVLKKGGHFVDGVALQPATTARTLRNARGKVRITDGPFAETKEVLGGVLVLEARDMDHAVELMRVHPGLAFGTFEIRLLDEEMTAKAKQR
ncbi:MAG: YciI family protein [Nevskiaceae bacterium]